MSSFFDRLKCAVERVDSESRRVKQLIEEEFSAGAVDNFTQEDVHHVKSVEKDVKKMHKKVQNLKAAVMSQSFSFDKYEHLAIQLREKLKEFESKHQLVEKFGYKTWQKPEPVVPPSEDVQEKEEDQIDTQDENDKHSESSSNTDSGKPDSPVPETVSQMPCQPCKPKPVKQEQTSLNVTQVNVPTTSSLATALFSTTFNCNSTIFSPNCTMARDMSSIREVTVEFTPGLTTKRPAPKARIEQVKNNLFESTNCDKASETYVKLPAAADISMSSTFQVAAPNSFSIANQPKISSNTQVDTPCRPIPQRMLDSSVHGNKILEKEEPVPPIPQSTKGKILPKSAFSMEASKDSTFKVPLPATPMQPTTSSKLLGTLKEINSQKTFTEPATPEPPQSCIDSKFQYPVLRKNF